MKGEYNFATILRLSHNIVFITIRMVGNVSQPAIITTQESDKHYAFLDFHK